MIKAQDAIRVARSLIGTPYAELDCINLIKKVIRTAPGGVTGYTTAGTNTLWNSRNASAKYRDLTWTQEVITGARAGMLAFKRSGENVHHVGLVTGDGTVIHSSSAAGKVVETALDGSWNGLAMHRYIGVELLEMSRDEEGMTMTDYRARVTASSLNVRNEPGLGGTRIGSFPRGTVVSVQADYDNGWRYVSSGGMIGYVDGQYLEAIPDEEQEAPEQDEHDAPEQAAQGAFRIFIVDSEGNRFTPVGDWRVMVGSVD